MKNPVNFRRGYELAMENAQAHLLAAEVIAEKVNYGIANSHLILASEEAIKAYMCFAKFYEPEIKIEKFEAYFSDHKLKHKAIKDMSFFVEFMKQMLIVSILPIKKLIKEKDDFTAEEFIESKNEGVENLIKWLKTIPEIDHNEQWWDQANTNKNSGFYVNILNKKWHSPTDIDQNTYSKSHKIVSEIIEYMKVIPNIKKDTKIQEAYKKIKAIQEGTD